MTEFASKIPEKEFSQAEFQSFLLEYKRLPHMAVETVQEWVVKTREGKRQMKRANSWVLQEGGDILGSCGVANLHFWLFNNCIEESGH